VSWGLNQLVFYNTKLPVFKYIEIKEYRLGYLKLSGYGFYHETKCSHVILQFWNVIRVKSKINKKHLLQHSAFDIYF